MESLELFEALNTVYTYQTVGQDNGVDTAWVFDNGTQKLGMKMAAIKPGALKKYKPAERVAQFFLFRVSETGKTGGAPKTIFKPLQTVATIATIVANQSQEHKLNAFVIRFPKEMDGAGLVNLMQRVANKISPVKYEQKGFYSFDGMQYGYALFVRMGRSIDSFFGKEWSKYIVHKDVIEYAATFNMTTVAPKQLDKMSKQAEMISGITRALDSQNIRMATPAKVEIQNIAGGKDIPDDVSAWLADNKTVYSSDKSMDAYPDFEEPVNPRISGSLGDIFGPSVDGLYTKYDELTYEPDAEQENWRQRFENKQITPADIANGSALGFIEEWLSEGFSSGWIKDSKYENPNTGKINMASAVEDACRGYINSISHQVYKTYMNMKDYVHGNEAKESVRGYTGTDYSSMNLALLKGGMYIESFTEQQRIKKLDKAFETTGVRLPEETLLYRGMQMRTDLLSETLKGKALHFRTFVSTSLRPNLSLYAFNADFGKVIQNRAAGYSADNAADSKRAREYATPQEVIDDIEARGVDSDKQVIEAMTYVAMIIRDAHKVPVIVPGGTSQYDKECEVILSRGTTMRVNDALITRSREEYNSITIHGVFDMSVLGANEVKLNEVYDGDHFVQTGELKKMGFSSFMESRRPKKLSKFENSNKFFAKALNAQIARNKSVIRTKKEKEEMERLASKFGGQLINDGDF